MLVHFPRITTDGLVLCLDAGNPLSYAGLGPELVTNSNLLVADDGNYETCFRSSNNNTVIQTGASVVSGKTYQISWKILDQRGSGATRPRNGFTHFSPLGPNVGSSSGVIYSANFYANSSTNGNLWIVADNIGVDFDLDYFSVRELPTTINDLSGNGNNGTLVNGVGYNSGNLGSLSFDGTNDYTENSSPNLGITGDISASLSCWFYDENTSTSTAQALFVYGNGPTSGDSIAIILQNLSFSAAYNGGNNAYIANNVYTLNKWNNVVITKTPGAVNTTTKLYLNGVEQTITSSSTITPNVSSRIVRVGRWSSEGFPIYFKGRVSNCFIYNRALTAQEIQQNFNATKGRYGL
jgi:hypothetical protein